MLEVVQSGYIIAFCSSVACLIFNAGNKTQRNVKSIEFQEVFVHCFGLLLPG